jgi:hypothetical protein
MVSSSPLPPPKARLVWTGPTGVDDGLNTAAASVVVAGGGVEVRRLRHALRPVPVLS